MILRKASMCEEKSEYMLRFSSRVVLKFQYVDAVTYVCSCKVSKSRMNAEGSR